MYEDSFVMMHADDFYKSIKTALATYIYANNS